MPPRSKVSSSSFGPPLAMGKKGNSVVVANAHAGIVPQTKPAVGPFLMEHKILTIGDGDLSFSVSLAMAFGGQRITATTYDSKPAVHLKYAHAGSNIRLLKQHGTQVHHNVDASELREDQRIAALGPFDRIVFMFPHLGGATAEDVQVNQQLVGRFLMTAEPLLAKDGLIVIGLRDTLFYRRWGLPKLAAIMQYSHEVQDFNISDFIGYQPVRTNPAVREAPPADNAQLHLFRPLPVLASKGNKRKKSLQDEAQISEDFAAPKPSKRARVSESAQSPPPSKAQSPPQPRKLRCDICHTPFSNQAKLNGHLNSKKHAQKFKLQMQLAKASGGPLPPELADPQVPQKVVKAPPVEEAKPAPPPSPSPPMPTREHNRRNKQPKPPQKGRDGKPSQRQSPAASNRRPQQSRGGKSSQRPKSGASPHRQRGGQPKSGRGKSMSFKKGRK